MKKILILCLISISFSQEFDYSKMSDAEKIMMYDTMKKSPSTGVLLEFLVTTLGHAYADNRKRGLAFKGGQIAVWIAVDKFGSTSTMFSIGDEDDLWTAIIGSAIIQIWEFVDVGLETKKYNKRLKRQIFGKKKKRMKVSLHPLQDGASVSFTYLIN